MIPSNASEKPIGIEGNWEIHRVRVVDHLVRHESFCQIMYIMVILLFFGQQHPENLPTKEAVAKKVRGKRPAAKPNKSMSTVSSVGSFS